LQTNRKIRLPQKIKTFTPFPPPPKKKIQNPSYCQNISFEINNRFARRDT
jgi:hypothetical protein